MVFLFREMAFQNAGERADKGMNLLLGDSLTQKVGEFFSTRELQKTGERLLVQLLVEAETNLMGVKGHDSREGKSQEG